MASNRVALTILSKELLLEYTSINQVDDGTIFYYRWETPMRLYVKLHGKEIDAMLPGEEIGHRRTHGESIFFYADGEIYKAVFSPPRFIEVSHARDMHEDEVVHLGGLCSREVDEETLFHRLCDDPEIDGIAVDLSEYELDGAESAGIIMGGKVFAPIFSSNERPTTHIRDNAVVVEIPDKNTTFLKSYGPHKSSSFLYFSNGLELYVLDTNNMEFLPELRFEGIDNVDYIAGVYNGVITIDGKIGDKYYLVTAQLPDGYFTNEAPVNEQAATEETEEETKKESDRQMAIDAKITSDNFNELLDHCCCTICNETFDSVKFIPRVLDCGHTLCEFCIFNYNVCVNNRIKCPNCARVIDVSNGKELTINYFAISIAEQTMKSRVDPKVTCKACEIKFSSSAVRMCIKEDCVMFNQLICLSCALDGGHGGHVVKYDVKLEKIRNEVRDGVTELCSQVEEIKKDVLEKSKKLVDMSNALETKLSETKIPPNVIGQIDSLASEQEARAYQEIVKDLAKTIMDGCRTLSDAFDHAINAASESGFELFDEKADNLREN